MLLTGRNLAKGYGTRLLFSGITLGLDQGERIGLIGANGSGKSTLLRVLAGIEPPDEGQIESRRGLRVAYVPQEDPVDSGRSCRQSVADAIDPAHLDEHDRLLKATILLDRADFPDLDADVASLSGGWRKRLAIVRALAGEPDLLLMDEPTNHLDLEGILELERQIASAAAASLIVSHDRRFLERTSSRIIELGRAYPDGYLSIVGTYSRFVEKRAEFLAAQQGRQQALDSAVRREVEWLRRGAKARTTKAKGRIERAGQMIEQLDELRQRITVASPAGIDFAATDRKTRKLISLKGVGKSLGGRTLFENIDLVLAPGEKLGLLGKNGSGKSTLIRILNGELAPDAGEVFRADGVRIVVFDQHRQQLDPTQTLRHALCPTGDTVGFQGQFMHITAWARRFLFRVEQLDLSVGELSGGEQARVLVARLMLVPADVLILDEPTNDLDIPTLDVLESSLDSFAGALVLVTHDRHLLDRVSTQLLALDGRGGATIYADLAQWESARRSHRPADSPRKSPPVPPSVSLPAGATAAPVRKRLTWKQQRELEQMEQSILDAEARVAAMEAQVVDPAVLADHAALSAAYAALAEAQQAVDRLYHRWSELDAMG